MFKWKKSLLKQKRRVSSFPYSNSSPENAANHFWQGTEGPSIFIPAPSTWMTFRELIHQENVQISYWVIRYDGVQVHPLKIEDHRAITWILEEGSHEYDTFKLTEEETVKVSLRSMPQIFSTDKVKWNLSTWDSMCMQFSLCIENIKVLGSTCHLS